MECTGRIAIALAALLASVSAASAADRLCDPAYENCRTPLLQLIQNEAVGIDVGFWFMQDTRYSTAIIERWQAGVPVRVVFDSEAFSGEESAAVPLQRMRDAGIPLRDKTRGGIFHFKMMLFAGQNTVQFSAANYSTAAFVPVAPYSNYVDEIIYFSDDPAIVNSFKTRFDDVWTDTTSFTSYANIPSPRVKSLMRHYDTYPIAAELNFVPWQNFRSRSLAAYTGENTGIDIVMYRITDARQADAMIAAVRRGVPVRLLTEPRQYRDASRLWHAYNVDRLYAAGVRVRLRGHEGLLHEKLTLLTGKRMAIFGSSNWTSASASSQHEHNMFTARPDLYAWLRDHFDRKWNNLGPSPESAAFTPLPPDSASVRAPANGAAGQPLAVTLAWYAGPWAHKYDIYLGTSSGSMTRILSDEELGPSLDSRDNVTWTVSGLSPGTTYYWRVVSRTMANVSRSSAIWTFTTEGTSGGGGTTPPPDCGALPSGWSTRDVGSVAAAGSSCYGNGMFTVTGSGADIWGTSDEFRFAYRTMSGDGAITARVASLDHVDAWTKAGVMMRETLNANSSHAMMIVSPARGLAFQRRRSAGGLSVHTSGGSGIAPSWVRLVRAGDTVTAYVSADGSAWTQVGSDVIAMTSTIFVGLAVTSHRDGTVAAASIDQVLASD